MSVGVWCLRYELAQLYDLEKDHVKALWHHAKNREQYPRFFRGRYRLAMSLEMVARWDTSDWELHLKDSKKLRQTLSILDSCGATAQPRGHPDDKYYAQHIFDCWNTTEDSKRKKEKLCVLKLALLATAQKELREIRKQLVLWRLLWASLQHRDERAILSQFLGLTERQRFHDGARVAELYITVRSCIADREKPDGSNPSGIESGEKSNTKRALRVVAAVVGESPVEITSLLPNSKREKIRKPSQHASRTRWLPCQRRTPSWQAARNRQHASRTRWLPWQRRTPSWQAAYNTACLYGTASERSTKEECEKIAHLAVISLKRAITPQDSEMQRPSNWINVDPAFAHLRTLPDDESEDNESEIQDFPQRADGEGLPGTTTSHS